MKLDFFLSEIITIIQKFTTISGVQVHILSVDFGLFLKNLRLLFLPTRLNLKKNNKFPFTPHVHISFLQMNFFL